MQVDKIVESINADAINTAQTIEQESKLRCEQILEAAKRRSDEKSAQLLSAGRTEGEQLKNRSLSVYALELRRNVLAVKRELIDEAFKAARDKAVSLGKEEYLKIVAALFAKLSLNGDETVLISPADQHVDEGFIKSINPGLTLRRDDSVKSGFVINRGGMYIDASIETVLSQLKSDMETTVANILFA